MPFDLSTAKPVTVNIEEEKDLEQQPQPSKFDLSTAQPTGKSDAAFLDTLAYGFEAGESDVTNVEKIASAKFPSIYKANQSLRKSFSTIQKDAEGNYTLYNPDNDPELQKDFAQFDALKTEDQRREYINKKKQDYLNKKYSNLTEEDKTSGGAITGQILKSLATPTTAIPVDKLFKLEKGVKGLSKFAGISGAFGAEYSALDQYARTGTIDPKQLAQDTAISAGGGVVLKGAVDSAGKIIRKTSQVLEDTRNAKRNTKAIKNANKAIDEIEYYTAEGIMDGVPQNKIMQYVSENTNLNERTIKKVINQADRPIKVPKSQQEAQKIFDAAYDRIDQARLKGQGFGQSTISKAIVPIHTTLQKIAPKVAARLRRYEFNLHNNTNKYLKRIKPFLQNLDDIQNLNPQSFRQLSLDLFNGNFNSAEKIINKELPNQIGNFKEVVKVLNELKDQLKATNPNMGVIDNYFPRQIKDLKAFYKSIGKSESSKIKAALQERARKLGIDTDELDPEEVISIINSRFKGYGNTKGYKPTFLKERKVAEVTDDTLDFYENPITRLSSYVRSSVNNIEKNNFFGKNVTFKGVNKNQLDSDASAGALVSDDLNNLGEYADQVEEILKVRFGQGELSPFKNLQRVRSLIYGMTIANPQSALVQLGDLGVSAYTQKFGNAIKSMLGAKKVTIDDLGLEDIAADFNDTGALAKALDGAFKVTGFRAVDRLGKNTLINAALNKYTNIASDTKKYAKEFRQFRQKYRNSFTSEEFAKLTDDLKAGNITDDVKYLLFNELSDVQPITLSEMPQYYLQSPNWRLAYALKSFTLKQLDLLRKTVYDQYQAGNKAIATRNAVAYLMIVTNMNTSVDQVRRMMNKQPVGIEEYKEDFVDNVLNLFGGSRYINERYLMRGEIYSAALNMVAPPLNIIDTLGRDVNKLLSDDGGRRGRGSAPTDYKSLRYTPLVGKFAYNWMGGGLEKQAYLNRKARRRKSSR